LADDLLHEGFTHITVVDLSAAALALAKSRLKERAKQVEWLASDITQLSLPESYYDVWHDRAVFHFLTTREKRRKYIDAMQRALKPGAYLVMATFSPEAPPTCSGLPVVSYSPAQLHEELGKELILEAHERELHMTPSGIAQQYIYCRFRRPA
jgi:ubiquinone/menaquinone biosynthesis C-methylase UbiE